MASLWERGYAPRPVAFVFVSSILLTACFVGVLGLLSGDLTDTNSRLPIYFLGMAVVFVITMFGLIRYDADGLTAMLGTIGISLLGLLLVGLAGEGLIYGIQYPSRVFGSTLLLYFLAAGLIGTGLGYWLLAFWREFTAEGQS